MYVFFNLIGLEIKFLWIWKNPCCLHFSTFSKGIIWKARYSASIFDPLGFLCVAQFWKELLFSLRRTIDSSGKESCTECRIRTGPLSRPRDYFSFAYSMRSSRVCFLSCGEKNKWGMREVLKTRVENIDCSYYIRSYLLMSARNSIIKHKRMEKLKKNKVGQLLLVGISIDLHFETDRVDHVLRCLLLSPRFSPREKQVLW